MLVPILVLAALAVTGMGLLGSRRGRVNVVWRSPWPAGCIRSTQDVGERGLASHEAIHPGGAP